MYAELSRRDTRQRVVAGQVSLLWPLLLFTLGDIALSLIGEALKTRLVWYMRTTDLIDLAALAPLYLVSLIMFHEAFLARGGAAWLRRAFLALAMIFMYGHAMHVTANAVNTFSTEIRSYGGVIPADAYALLYFFDETLSHWIVFLARFGLFACLFELAAARPTEAERAHALWPGLALGALYGIWQAIVFTEGQKAPLAPILALALGGLWAWRYHASKSSLAGFLRGEPIRAFVAGLVPSMLLGLGLYALVAGGFVEPSKLGV